MSYDIEYNRQFLKTSSGFIPMMLLGPSNVYDGNKRTREWCIPYKELVNKTEPEMLRFMQGKFNQYDEHWMRGGKYITNSGLLSWISSGCASACTIEDFRLCNPYSGFSIAIVVYDGAWNGHEFIRESPKTTSDLESWYSRAQAFLATEQPERWRYDVSIHGEKIIHPPVGDGLFALRISGDSHYGNGLFYATRITHSTDLHEAKLLTVDGWRDELLAHHLSYSLNDNPTFIPVADEQAFRENHGFVIKVQSAQYPGWYVCSTSRTRTRVVMDEKNANRYASRSSAEQAKKRIEKRTPSLVGSLSVAEV